MSALAITLAIVFLLDALRLALRVRRFKVVTSSESTEGMDQFCVVVVDGVSMDAPSRRAVVAHALAEGLDVVDVIPRRWHTLGILSLSQLVDPGEYRQSRLSKGRSAGYAMVVRRALLERAGYAAEDTALSPLHFVRMARRLKLYACTSTDFGVVPGLRSSSFALGSRRALLHETLGAMTWVVLLGQPLFWALLVTLVVFEPLWGAVTLAAFHCQPALVLLGGPVRAWDLPFQLLGRLFVDVWIWVGTLLGRWTFEVPDDPVPALRSEYEAMVAAGLDVFFEARRKTCPLCEDSTLKRLLTTSDLVQRKPGVFSLDECGSCAHVFQNPRLSIAGLNYYYRDFYDGLGEEGLEAVFGFSAEPYWVRARMLQGHVEPQRWLDVGAGHGHFCCVARDVWPDSQFDALDLSESVEEAARRAWADHGHRGLFPELAPSLGDTYDVVSMSHYLEHTREPIDEIKAAHQALKDGGILFIEIPDPECRLGRLLGRWWLPWFQPQHQHLMRTENLKNLLEEQGFDPLTWHHGEAHQPVDFLFATYLQINRLSPIHNEPWAPALGVFKRVVHTLVWTGGIVWIGCGWTLDRLLGPIMRRARHSNTLRVIARKRS